MRKTSLDQDVEFKQRNNYVFALSVICIYIMSKQFEFRKKHEQIQHNVINAFDKELAVIAF